MPVGHYQRFKFSLASEAVLPDNCIVLVSENDNKLGLRKTFVLATTVSETHHHTQLLVFGSTALTCLLTYFIIVTNSLPFVPATALPTLCIGTGFGNSVCPSGSARQCGALQSLQVVSLDQ